MDDELRAALREAAGDHRPDRARMLARVERGIGDREPARSRRPVRPRTASWLRVAGATAAVAGVLAAGGYAVTSAVRDGAPAGGTVATGPAPASSRTPDSSRSLSEDGYLWADGSVDPGSNRFWAQSNVTVRTREPLTALTVELRIARNGGVTDTGSWRTLPVEDFDVSVAGRGGFLVYRWTLKAGRTVPVGQHVFAGQYNHAEGGRSAYDDGYTVRSDAAGTKARVEGGFAPAG